MDHAEFDDSVAQAVLLDSVGAVDALVVRREALERQMAALVPDSPWAQTLLRRAPAGAKHPVWQLTAIDVASYYAWAEARHLPLRAPTGAQTSKLALRVATELRNAGWALERVICDNGGEFRSRVFSDGFERLGARKTHIHAGRPQTNVEALHRTILDECWRPAFARYLRPPHRAQTRARHLRRLL